MKEYCNICQAQEFTLIKDSLRDDKEKYKVFCCNKCRHIQLLPRPTPEEDKKFYDKNQQDKNRGKTIDFRKLRTNNQFDTKRHIKLFFDLSIAKDSRILDVGAGYGFFIQALKDEGYRNVLGAEVSEERRAVASKYIDAKIINYDIDDPKEDIGTFDVVTLFHVLEHTADPVAFLKNIRRLMNQQGILMCEVPNVCEILLDNCTAYNDFYWIRAHLNYFSNESLLDCFKKAGFSRIALKFQQRYGLINLCNWLTVGKPQIEQPIFEMNDAYKPIEDNYRRFLEGQGRSDALIAIARL